MARVSYLGSEDIDTEKIGRDSFPTEVKILKGGSAMWDMGGLYVKAFSEEDVAAVFQGFWYCIGGNCLFAIGCSDANFVQTAMAVMQSLISPWQGCEQLAAWAYITGVTYDDNTAHLTTNKHTAIQMKKRVCRVADEYQIVVTNQALGCP